MHIFGEYPIGFVRRRTLPLLLIAGLLPCGHFLPGCAAPEQTDWLGIDVRLATPIAGSQPASAPNAPIDGEVDFRLMAELGVNLLRVDLMDWSRVQPGPEGRYDFSAIDRLVRLADKANIEITAVCSGVPAWAAANPPAKLPARDKSQAFVNFVRAFVERYGTGGVKPMPGLHRPIRAFECFEAPEDTPTAEYAYWLKAFHDAVKGVSPKAIVVLGSLASPGLKDPTRPQGDYDTFFERFLAEVVLEGPSFPYFDVVGFQNYPRSFPGRPPFEHNVIYLRQKMGARHIDRPIWLTAFGAASNDPHARGDDRQAAELVRWAIHGRTLGLDRMYLHTLRDAPAGQAQKDSPAFGLVRAGGGGQGPALKPAFQALTILLGILKSQGHVTRRADGVYMLSGQEQPTYVVWSVPSYDPSPFLISGWWDIRTINGQREVREGREIRPTDKPIFLRQTTSPFIR